MKSRMQGLLTEVQRLEGLVIVESESKRKKFEKCKQLLPRERVARLPDRGTPFLEISRLADTLVVLDAGKVKAGGPVSRQRGHTGATTNQHSKLVALRGASHRRRQPSITSTGAHGVW